MRIERNIVLEESIAPLCLVLGGDSCFCRVFDTGVRSK